MTDKLLQINKALQHRITNKIKQNGKISFAQFMNMALYEPGLGYYSAGLHKIGSEGDFVTSSELGALFAKCHASVFAEVLPQLENPVFIELGAGTGQFCFDLLKTLDQYDCLPSAYQIIEVSADFKQVQQQKLKNLPPHIFDLIQWHNDPPCSPYQGILFANEVIDAIPVEIFLYKDHDYFQLHLAEEDEKLTEQWHPFNSSMNQQLQQMDLDLADGYRSEFLPQLDAWIETITKNMERGLAMFVDYGYGRRTYYHPQRSTGTLVCQKRHQANFNPYQDVGLQDITAFVNFTAVAESLEKADFEVAGYTTQGDFLVSAGINQFLDPDANFTDYYRLVSEMKQLVLPEEMGEKFKTMVAIKNISKNIKGFELNRWHEL